MVDAMAGSRFSLRLGRESDESWNEERSRAEDVHRLRKIIVDVVNIRQDNRETRGSVSRCVRIVEYNLFFARLRARRINPDELAKHTGHAINRSMRRTTD